MFKFNLVGGSSRGMLAGQVLILEVALLAFLNRNLSQNQLSSKSVTPDLDKSNRWKVHQRSFLEYWRWQTSSLMIASSSLLTPTILPAYVESESMEIRIGNDDCLFVLTSFHQKK